MGKHRRRYEKQNQRVKSLKAIIIIFIFIAILASLITVFARYASNSLNNFFLESKEFYFYSDKLTSEGAEYQIDNWSGVEDYNITINMNSIKNNLKKTSYDIGYDISYTASDNVICQLSKESGIISAQSNSDYFNLRITPNAKFQNGDIVTIKIIVNSTSGYKKELSATFKLVVGQENVTYQIEDKENNPYLELNITNTQSYYFVKEAFDNYDVGDKIDINDYLNLSDSNKNKCYSAELTLLFDPNEIVIDNTDKNYLKAVDEDYRSLDGYTYLDTITIEVDALSSKNIRFYKKDKTKDYTYPIVNDKSVITVNIK